MRPMTAGIVDERDEREPPATAGTGEDIQQFQWVEQEMRDSI